MRKFEYVQYADNLRLYDSERQADRAEAVARRLDSILKMHLPYGQIADCLQEAKDIRPAVFARMTRLGRLFYADVVEAFPGEVVYLLLGNRAAYPRAYGKLLYQRNLIDGSALKGLISDFSGSDAGLVDGVANLLRTEQWLVPRFLQDDVFLACGETARKVLLDLGRQEKPIVRRLFVAQIMNSEWASHDVKAQVYRRFKPYAESFIREKSENVHISTRLLGRKGYVTGPHIGLSNTYSANTDRPDYSLAVCEDVQRAYAECGYFRYQWARSELPGYETVRCAFPRFATMSDRWHDQCFGKELDEFSRDDNPGYFRLMCDMHGSRIGLRQFAFLMMHRRRNILKYIVEDCADDLLKSLSLEQVLFYVSAYGNWSIATEIADSIESVAPGTVARAVDQFGNTPIWYTLYELETTCWDLRGAGHEADRHEYVRHLESLGCDPCRQNHLGISYADVAEEFT